MEFNPIDKIDDLIARFREYSPIIRSKTDKGFDWLDENSFCIEIPNPDSDAGITIECEYGGEFTVCFSNYHSHFFADDYEYGYMCEEISKILNNQCSCATIFLGSENEWLGSTLAEKEQLISPIEDMFDFVFKNSKRAEMLYKSGGEARFVFWNSGLNKIIKICKK